MSAIPPSTKFSLLMPTRNRRNYISGVINNLMRQTWTNWELLISASGDGISDLLPNDPRIIHTRRQSDRITDGLNQLRALATGDVLSVYADDDIIMPSALRNVAFHMEDGPQWLVGRIASEGNIIGETCTYAALLDANLIPCPAVYWTRKASDATGEFDCGVAFDYDYWLRMWLAVGPPKFTQDVFSIYRRHPGQTTNTEAEEVRVQAQRAKDKALCA